MEQLGQNFLLENNSMVTIISQDSFYRDLTPEEHKRALKGLYNFDHPGWFKVFYFSKDLKSKKAKFSRNNFFLFIGLFVG